MLLEHQGKRPRIHATAYIAPTATVCGDVTIGAESRVLFGAVLVAEGGPVAIGGHCIIMEQAVLRGTARHPIRLADHVLVGPHAHLSGCTVEGSVRIWAVQKTLEFPRTVFGLARAPEGESIMPEVTRRYARALGSHRHDHVLGHHHL